MPITCINVTDIAHDDHRIETLLLEEVYHPSFSMSQHNDNEHNNNVTKTGRKLVLDADWITFPTGIHKFFYDSEIEFILVKTNMNVIFRRVTPINAEAGLDDMDWEHRNGEHYYIFKIDPQQKSHHHW